MWPANPLKCNGILIGCQNKFVILDLKSKGVHFMHNLQLSVSWSTGTRGSMPRQALLRSPLGINALFADDYNT